MVVTPGAIPSKAWPMFVIGLTPNFSALTLAEEPVKEAFFAVPNVVITTSSKVEVVEARDTLITVLLPTLISCGA